VPIFSISRLTRDSLLEATGAGGYASVNLLPACDLYATGLPGEDQGSVYYIRPVGGDVFDVHRIYQGQVMESFSTQPGMSSFRLMQQRCMLAEAARNGQGAQLLEVVSSCDCGTERDGAALDLPARMRKLDEPLVGIYARSLQENDVLRGFMGTQRIKPYKVPALAWVALLLVALYGVFAWSRFTAMEEIRYRSAATEARLEEVKTKWQPLATGQQLLKKSQEMESALEAYPEQSLPPLVLTEYLTRVTPEDTWISELRLEGRKLSIRGESASAVKYQAGLSDLGPFENVDFRSGIRRQGRSDKDAFMLFMDVSRRDLLDAQDNGARPPASEGAGE
jgi:hypothetical protein